MKNPLPRARFNSSRLIRLLTELADGDAAEPKQAKSSFAERLGQWLGFADAIALSAALNSPAAKTAGAGAASSTEAADASISAQFARVRGSLVAAIRGEGTGKARIRLPEAPADFSAAIAFAPYRRYCLAHQRDMAAEIGQLRIELRAALTRHSPALAQLAALDAVFDRALGERERELLAKVPALLETRFTQRQAAAASGRQATPASWLAAFCGDLQTVLLAELELRLQPVQGLLETLNEAQNKACREEAAAASIS